MHLDPIQEGLLRGKEGEARQLAMEMLVKSGEESLADTLVPIKSAHVKTDYLGLGNDGVVQVERFVSAGARFAVPTSLGPASVDMGAWESFDVPSALARAQIMLCEAFSKLGGMRSWTCVPYQVCNFPKPGEAVAWTDRSAVLFANSVLGCRTNVTPPGVDVACAVLGLAPRFGMLGVEGDAAQVVFIAPKGDLADLEYGSLGYAVGKGARGRIPAVEGLPKNVTSDEIKHFVAAMSCPGSVQIARIVGVTPGTPTLQAATRGERVERVAITRSDLAMVREELSQTDEEPDLVALGAPQLSASELGLFARLLKGRKAKPGIKIYAYTSPQALEMASMSGIRAEIEAAGCALSWGTDADVSPLKAMGFNIVMTNSALLAITLRHFRGLKTRYASLREIVEEATS